MNEYSVILAALFLSAAVFVYLHFTQWLLKRDDMRNQLEAALAMNEHLDQRLEERLSFLDKKINTLANQAVLKDTASDIAATVKELRSEVNALNLRAGFNLK